MGVYLAEHEDDGSGSGTGRTPENKATEAASRNQPIRLGPPRHHRDRSRFPHECDETLRSTRVAANSSARREGEYRPGPYYLPISGGWLPAGVPITFGS